MKIRVLHFAQVREACGADADLIELPDLSRVSDSWAVLVRLHPGLESLKPLVFPAVNLKRVSWDAGLHEGDEVSFLAPTGGG